MKGSLRVLIGFLMTYGAVGSLDFDPTADVVVALLLASVGLIIMYSGVLALKGVK
jgi:hypothetical protein